MSQIPDSRAMRLAAASLLIIAGMALVWSSDRARQSDNYLALAKTASGTQAFDLAARAYILNPLARGPRAALPVYLDSYIQSGSRPTKAQIDSVLAIADRSAHWNTAALIARCQIAMTYQDDQMYAREFADLSRGSSRVTAVYAIEARWLILHGQAENALAVLRQADDYRTLSSVPDADRAIFANIDSLRSLATEIIKRKGTSDHE